MFKVGDIVKRIRNEMDRSANTLPIGRVFIVTNVLDFAGSGVIEVAYYHGHGNTTKVDGSWFANNFEALRFEELHPPATPKAPSSALPLDSEKRKQFPLFSGLLAYFPAALAQVSNHSFEGNEKHNPGKPLQHARGKSGDHLDCVLRHIVDSREVTGSKRVEELRAAGWRILAELQEELERQGVAPAAPAATFE